MTLPFGIDVSKWQGVNDYAKMKANTSFVFVKTTESWGYTDPKFYKNWTGLVGHNRGAYCYVWLSDDPLRQADHLMDIVTQAGVDWKYDRLVLDLERSGHGLSKAEVSGRVLIMMERIREITGRYPVLYSRANWVNYNMLINDPRLINADWWLAYYRTALPYPLFTPEMPSPPLLPAGVSKWLFHQTCERGKGSEVGVGSYYVDQNRFNGTREELDSFFGLTEETAPPVTPPEPEPDKVLYQVKAAAPLGLNVRQGAGTNFPKAGSLKYGTVVPVYEKVSTGWLRIGLTQWVAEMWTKPVESTPPQEPPTNDDLENLLKVEPWSQHDPRWANDRMGSSYFTMGVKGCLMTVTAAGLTALGYPITPGEYNRQASSRGGYEIKKEGDTIYANMYWLFPDALTNGKIKRAEYHWIYYNRGWQDMADKILLTKRPVWVEVRLNGLQHWFLITGKVEGKYWGLDPDTGSISPFNYDRVYRLVSYRR